LEVGGVLGDAAGRDASWEAGGAEVIQRRNALAAVILQKVNMAKRLPRGLNPADQLSLGNKLAEQKKALESILASFSEGQEISHKLCKEPMCFLNNMRPLRNDQVFKNS